MSNLQLGERGVSVDGVQVITPERALQNVEADADIIASGELHIDRLPGIPGEKIESGTIDVDRLPGIPGEKIDSGEIDVDRIPDLPAEILTSGELADARVAESNVTQHAAALEIGMSQLTGTLPVGKGGTGLATLGTALQIPRINAGATALEYIDFLPGREDWELLADHLQTGSGASSIDWSGLSTSYRSFRIIARIVRATANAIQLALNNDTGGTNYDSLAMYIQTNGSAVAYDNPGATAVWTLGGSSTDNGAFWHGDILVSKPTTGLAGMLQATIGRYGGTAGNRMYLQVGSWDNTSDLINRITLGINPSTIGVGSSVRLYGYRGGLMKSTVTKQRRESDADGAWEVKEYASGVVARVMVEPSEEYTQQRAADLQTVRDRQLAAESARETKKDAIRNATSVAQLRNAMLDYLGIEAGDGTKSTSFSESA